MFVEFKNRIEGALKDAVNSLSSVKTLSDLEGVKVAFMGRKGIITILSKQIKDIPQENRPEAGKLLNECKQRLRLLLDEKSGELAKQASSDVEYIDVSLPGRKPLLGRKHPISQVIDKCVNIFRNLGFIVARGPEIETVYNNFDALNTPDDHPSRDVQDTFYLPDGRLLRTQTSPVQIRVMKSQSPPVRIVAPGRCFRRDTPDATHSMNFHQIEGLYIDKEVSLADLRSVLLHFGRELFGQRIQLRLRPHFFPFTEPSVECDFSCILCAGKGCNVCKNSGWLEIAGAGMVDPAVLREVGYDPEEWTGYAFGMGIERIAMIMYGIPDIRFLYENNIEFLRCF